MIKNLNQILRILTIAGLLSACSSSESGHIGEPNNTILEAGMLESGKSYTMKIDSIGDIDWYSVPVKGPGYVKISTKTAPENLTLNVRYAEKQAWKPEKQKWLSKWSNIPKTMAVEKADTLYFAIVDNYSDKASDKSIEFKVDFIPEFDKLEPNNSSKNTHLVSSGELMKTAFFPKTDQDWFKIKVDKPGYLMIQARSVPENIKVNARYAKKSSNYSKVEFFKNWQELPAGTQITEPGVYYFVLLDNYNDQMSTEIAEWKIDFVEEMDSMEPNNSFVEAYPVAIGDTLKPVIFPIKDSDYFTMTPDSTVAVWLHSQNPKNINAQVRLFSKNGFQTTPVGKWENMPVQYELKGGNQYYFQLIDDFNNEFSKKPVLLTISPADDSRAGIAPATKPL